MRSDGAWTGISVFLADDHAVVRDGLRVLLEDQPDMRVIGDAADGREALDGIERLGPDVAVLDIAMPELNGIEVAREVRELSPETAVVVLSMHSTSEHVFRALEAGARGYVVKESAGAEVVEAVRAVHGGRRFLSDRVSDHLIDDYVRQQSATTASSPLSRLSPRETEVLQMVVEGKTSAEIAESLFLAPSTVETYRSRLMSKLHIDNLPALVRFAILHGLTPLE
jgi:DNA-binding NarL/FixJ family response regulator